jgi:hypothetical protein
MKTDPERCEEDVLLDALLRDEEWQAASATIKQGALGAFRARQQVRRLTRAAVCLAVCAVAIAGATHWFGRTAGSRPTAVALAEAPAQPKAPRYLTDEELLASFPKGSCFLAEVDGKRELIFLDPKVERLYVARPEKVVH